jgi:hypothetical protein
VKSEETDPTPGMNGILVGMVAFLRDVIGDVVNCDHPVGQNQDDKEQENECKIA